MKNRAHTSQKMATAANKIYVTIHLTGKARRSCVQNKICPLDFMAVTKQIQCR
jgi:hypothetical protein